MFTKELPVLLVDDDPDLLSVSKLAMRGFEVFGMPITVHTAASKAEAIERIATDFSVPAAPGALLNLAFVDVVMETDTAGLELCDHIRNTLKNKFTQIYVRTGQPGVAPEREVIDTYDINGYFTKVEATPDKLYTLVKSGIREAYFTGLAQSLSNNLQRLIYASPAKEAMATVLQRGWGAWDVDFVIGYLFEDRVIGHGLDDASLRALRDELGGLPATPIGDAGDSYVVDGHRLLVDIVAGPDNAALTHVVSGYAPPSDVLVPLIHGFARSFAALWHKGS